MTGPTLLVIEENDDVRNLIGLILETAGYRVLLSAGATEAIRLAKQHPESVDLLLLDATLREMPSPDLTARLTATWPNAKVIYMSGLSAEMLADDNLYKPGMVLLEKPFLPSALLQKVAEMLAD